MKRFKHLPYPFLTLFLMPSIALAAGYQNPALSASDVGSAFAGGGSAIENASAQAYNPASLSRLKGISISSGGLGIKHRARFWQTNQANDWLGAGNFYAATELGESWVMGLAANQPFLLENRYEKPWESNEWNQNSELKITQIAANVAWRTHEKFSLGLGISYARAQWELDWRNDKDNALGWNVGVLLTPSESMNVSVSYQSPFHFKGYGWQLKTPGKFVITTWQALQRGWELMGKIEYTQWHNNGLRFYANHIQLPNMTGKHSLKIAWGTALNFYPGWKVKFGLAYDISPIRKENRTAILPEHNDWYISTGLRYAHQNYGALDLGYSYVYSSKSDAATRDFAGRFQTDAHLLGLQYSIGF